MATASQNITEIRFFERIRGARTAAPRSDEPVMKMPHAAPKTERPIARPAPTKAHAYGSMPSTTCEGAQKHKVSAKGASGMKVGPTEDDAALP